VEVDDRRMKRSPTIRKRPPIFLIAPLFNFQLCHLTMAMASTIVPIESSVVLPHHATTKHPSSGWYMADIADKRLAAA